MSSLNNVSGYCALEPLPRQLLGTLKQSRLYVPCKVYHWLSCQSMVALRLLSAACSCAALPFASMQKPTGEGSSNRLGSDSCAVEPLPTQLLGTLKPSMVALHPFPTGEGTSNCLGSDSSNIHAALKRVFKKAKFTDFVELEVEL